MALQLTTTNPDTGAPRNYIRIDQINMPNLLGGGIVALGYYVDQTAADAGLKPDQLLETALTDAEANELRVGGLQLLYAILKARAEFSGATDV